MKDNFFRFKIRFRAKTAASFCKPSGHFGLNCGGQWIAEQAGNSTEV